MSKTITLTEDELRAELREMQLCGVANAWSRDKAKTLDAVLDERMSALMSRPPSGQRLLDLVEKARKAVAALNAKLEQQRAMLAKANAKMDKGWEETPESKELLARAVAAETALMNILKHVSRDVDEIRLEWTVHIERGLPGTWTTGNIMTDVRAGWAVIDKLVSPPPHHPRDY